MLTTTPATLGLDRARPSVHTALSPMSSWRGASFAPGFCGSTGLSTTADMASVNEINDTVGNGTQTKRPTRHLGTRST